MALSKRALHLGLGWLGTMAGLLLASPGWTQATNEDSLNGTYYAHDLYEVFSDRQELGRGLRIFNENGVLNRLFTYPDSTALNYVVASDATFRLFTSTFNQGFGGSIGLGGQLAVFTREAPANQDAQVRDGYASLQVSIKQTSGRSDSNFSGSYSYHGLLRLSTGAYQTSFGLADSNGRGAYVLIREDRIARNYTYDVASDGTVDLDGQGDGSGALIAGGGLLVNTADVGSGDDAEIPGGYTGLALYLRRYSGNTATTEDFLGTYRIHRISANGSATPSADLGTVTAGGNGYFFGTVGGQAYEGQIALNGSGTFTFEGSDDYQGTLGEAGDIALVTTTPGNTPVLEVWVRVAGGAGNSLDSDGDGLTNAEEGDLGTSTANPDTDGDGLLDNTDERPLVADNVFEATLSETALTAEVNGPAITNLTLDLDSDNFPFFEWELSSNVSWLSFETDSGTGDDTIPLRVNIPALNVEDSPHVARIDIDAPAMSDIGSLTLTVTISSPQVDLALNPDTVVLTVVEGGDPASATVALTSPDGDAFSWRTQTDFPWISVTPNQGSGPQTVTIAVNPATLLADNSPYIGTVVFIPGGSGPKQFPVTVRATVVEEREVDVPFPVANADTVQSQPAVAFDTSTGIWAITWIEDQQVIGALYDAELLPLTQPIQLSLNALGTAAQPAAVAVEAEDEVWVFWEQRTEPTADAFIQGRGFDLSTLALTSAFGVTSGSGNKTHPRAVYNAAANHVAVLYGQEFASEFFLGLVRLDGASRNSLSSGFAAPSDNDQFQPDIAWLPEANEYLVVWREDSTVDDVTTSTIRAQRLAGNSGNSVGDTIVIDDDAPGAEGIRVAAAGDRWVVIWSETPGLFQGTAVQADGATSTVHTLDEARAPDSALAIAYNTASRQSILAWNRGGSTTQAALHRTVAGNGQGLGDALPFPNMPPRIGGVAAGANAVANEFLLVWEDPDTLPRQLTALRLAGGSDDVDGDGLPNAWELEYGLDPGSNEGDDGATGDPDRDGLPNVAEFMLGTDPTNPDSDDDGLLDGQEDLDRDGVLAETETSPLLADSDGDGVRDDVEWFLGSDGRDGESTPGTGIYRVDYGTWTPGAAGTLTVSFHIAEPGDYALHVNPEGDTKQVAPAGWTLASEDDGSVKPYAAGAHTITFTLTPGEDVTPTTAYAMLHFVLADGSGNPLSTNTPILVADLHQTLPESGGTTADDLARAYAPVLRLHRDAMFTPVPVEVSLKASTLDIGNTMTLRVAPSDFDLEQSPNSEAYLDLPGTEVNALFAAYPAGEDLPDPALYYTVTPLGDRSEEPGANPDHVAIQYYLHFFADLWGFEQAGGHRHEGDWEVFQVLLDEERTPYFASASQQWQRAQRAADTPGGESRSWEHVERTSENRPVLYVGQGGHSLYFTPGATRYATASEVHDGLGVWLLPDSSTMTPDYAAISPLSMIPLGRLADVSPTPWLRFAGRWGQPAYPVPVDDDRTPEVNDGPVGPAFLGTAGDSLSGMGVPHIYADPFAFAARMPQSTDDPLTNVRGIVDSAAFFGKTLALLDARGRIYTTPIIDGNGSFDVEVPVQNYQIALIELPALARPSLLATGSFSTGFGDSPLFGAVTDLTPVGLLTEADGDRVTGVATYPFNDTDGDGLLDHEDPDMDGDGIPNATDVDVLGDGWDDRFQVQDPDQDGIPSFFDTDDDGDDLADGEDPDANGNGVPDVEDPADTDGDGFVDAIDLDQDNDGFDNAVEAEAGSNPRHYLDTPFQQVGDINADGEINAVDGQQLINMALGRAPYAPLADYSLNGVIDAADLQALINDILAGSTR
jgi:hypothetical protein